MTIAHPFLQLFFNYSETNPVREPIDIILLKTVLWTTGIHRII